ncbi:Pleckstrin y domaincontaining H member 2 [Blomia tropicalis]|nr:Pleckstrin y domaincontaining H member 2 [Blomia tropicalis]
MDHSSITRNNPFNEDEDVGISSHMVDVSQMKEWVSSKLKALEDQNHHLKEENRKFNQELTRLKEIYVKKSLTPEVRRKTSRRELYANAHKYENLYDNVSSESSSTDDNDDDDNETFFVTKPRFHKNPRTPNRTCNREPPKSNNNKQPRIDGSSITLLSGNSRQICSNRAGSLDRKLSRMKRLNFNEMKKQSRLNINRHKYNNNKKWNDDQDEQKGGPLNYGIEQSDPTMAIKPPTPPLHRCPSWESRIYEIANNGIKSVISTPIQPVKRFEPSMTSQLSHNAESDTMIPIWNEKSLPIFQQINGRVTKVRLNSFDESMSSEFEGFALAKASSTTSSGNESDFQHQQWYPMDGNISDSSQDYVLPPDAKAAISMKSLRISDEQKNVNSLENRFEKSGYLLKLSGRFRTWKRRWFVVKQGVMMYYKSHEDYSIKLKPKTEIILDPSCKLVRSKQCRFQLSYKDGKKSIQLSADCLESFNDWIRVINHSLTYHNIMKLQENQVPIIENNLVKVRFGHSLKCLASLYGQYLVYFTQSDCQKIPLGFTDLKNSKVQQMDSLDNIDDTVFIYEDTKRLIHNSISIHAKDNSEPIYLLFFSKQDFNLWLHHLTTAASDDPNLKTGFEQFLTLLSSVEFNIGNDDEFYRNPIWNNPSITFTTEPISEPLTSLSTIELKTEAVKLFKSIQLFTSVPIDNSAIDYHVSVVQNSLKICFEHVDLQSELYFQLIKQSTPCKELAHLNTNAIHTFLCSPQSIFNQCETTSGANNEPSSSEKSSPSSSSEQQIPTTGLNASKYSTMFLQCFQFLSVMVSIFEPKNQVLWLLKHHLNRTKDQKTELGKYAFYCERALQRQFANGPRRQPPSRMEVLSILQRNPYKHSMPHSIPVHFSNGSYLVVGFDGSSTVSEFVQMINSESGIRENQYSGFALFSDDPLDDQVEHLLNPSCKLADIISHWESNLRKYHLGKFESTKAIKLTYKHRLCLKRYFKNETDKERILWVYDINASIVSCKFPIMFDLAIELMALLMQIENGDIKHRDSSNLDSIYDRSLNCFLPVKFRKVSNLKELILTRWTELCGRSTLDCVRIYLNCTRRTTDLCGSAIFPAKVSNSFKYDDMTSLQLCKIFSPYSTVWIAVCEDLIELLEVDSFRSILRIPHRSIINFGGYRSHFMLMVNGNMLEKVVPEMGKTIPFTEIKSYHGQRLLFQMPKKSIVDITMLLADYINLISNSNIEQKIMN